MGEGRYAVPEMISALLPPGEGGPAERDRMRGVAILLVVFAAPLTRRSAPPSPRFAGRGVSAAEILRPAKRGEGGPKGRLRGLGVQQ